MKKLALFFIILCTTTLTAYIKPDNVPQDVWESVEPYFLPQDHPDKAHLDKIFSSNKRHIHDYLSLFKAGFDFKVREKWDQIIVVDHPKLKKVKLKLYLDTQLGVPDWVMWIKRIQGAEITQQAIDSLNVGHLFKVPKKYIYPLPETSIAAPGTTPKHFILVVENMHLKSNLANERMWKSPYLMTEERLRAIYLVLAQAGLKDSVYIDNLPFSTDGKQAFIDTEHFLKWPIHYNHLTTRLPKSVRPYWKHLIIYGE